MKNAFVKAGTPTALCLIRKSIVPVAGKNAVYRLLCEANGEEGYYVQVVYGKESAMAFLHMREATALVFFADICRGRVTPCTLADIVADRERDEDCALL